MPSGICSSVVEQLNAHAFVSRSLFSPIHLGLRQPCCRFPCRSLLRHPTTAAGLPSTPKRQQAAAVHAISPWIELQAPIVMPPVFVASTVSGAKDAAMDNLATRRALIRRRFCLDDGFVIDDFRRAVAA